MSKPMHVIFSVPTGPGDHVMMHHSDRGENGIKEAFAMIDLVALLPGLYLLTGTLPFHLEGLKCRRLTRDEAADLAGSDDPNTPIRFPWTKE